MYFSILNYTTFFTLWYWCALKDHKLPSSIIILTSIWVIPYQIYNQNFDSPEKFFPCSRKEKKWHVFFYILIMDEKVLVLCEKWLSKFSSNLYVLRPPESEKIVFTKVSVCLSVRLSVCLFKHVPFEIISFVYLIVA